MPSIRKRHGQWQDLRAVELFALSFLGLALAGCGQGWDPDTDGGAVACRSTYNFMPGTPEFEQCMQRFREMDARKKGGRFF
jgi:hypothetical protein